jgi:phosphoglycerate dehydrogenase-like enzyme
MGRDRFRVAVSSDFLRPDGSLAYPSVDFSPLNSNPELEYEFLPPNNKLAVSNEILADDVAGFDALLLWTERFTERSAKAGNRLALLRRFGAGYEKIDVSACTASSVALSTSNEGVRRPVAVMLLTLILAATGKLLIKDRLVRAAPERWEERIQHMGVGLVGKTLGLIGVGNTGAETVRLATPLDMKFIAYDPFVAPEQVAPLGVQMVGLDEVFSESDIVVVTCPLTRDTYHLVNGPRLARMKPTAFFINGARGPIVHQPALVAALQSGRIAGAGLDVFEKEPPDPDDPIKSLDNVILSPHALCWTDQCFADCFTEATDAVLRVMHGHQPGGIINREILNDGTWLTKLATYRQRFGG